MRHHLVRRAAFAACLVFGAVATAAGPACHAAAPVLLLNGDLAEPAAGGVPRGCSGDLFLLRPAGQAGPLLSFTMGSRRYLFPLAAIAYLGRGLDPSLFDVGALARVESGGRLPVRVAYSHGAPSLPGLTITRRRPGLTLGYLTRAGAREFEAALLRQFLADHARGSYGQDGMFTGGVSLSLAGGAPAPAPSPRFPMTTLTVTATNLAGRPDTGDVMFVLSAEHIAPLGLPVAFNFFYHGVTKLSVPLGHYWGFGVFFHVDLKARTSTVRVAVLPRFTAGHGGSTVRVAERAADSKIQMITARPADANATGVNLIHSEASGPPADWAFLEEPFAVRGHGIFPASSLYLSPTGRLAPRLLRTVTVQWLSSPPGANGVPYRYSLAYFHSGGIGPQRFVARPGSLATVSTRYFAAPGEVNFHIALPLAVTGLAAPGFPFVGYVAPGYAFSGPLCETSYFSAGPALRWAQEYDQGVLKGTAQSEVRAFHPGQRLTENWDAYPLHPGPDVMLAGTSLAGPVVPSGSRAGDTLRLDWPAFSDNVPGHTGGFTFDDGTIVSYRIDQNGKQVAAGTRTGGLAGTVAARVKLAAARSLIRFTLDAAQPAGSHRLSTATNTVWTWRSAHESGSTLPAGWTCAPQAVPPARVGRSCGVEPMMTLRYAVKGLALNESAPAGRQVLAVAAGHLQLARASRVTRASVAVSFDGGKTWHTARLTGHDGSYTAVFSAPAGARVSLRTSAADAAGGSVTQTIINAYQVAS